MRAGDRNTEQDDIANASWEEDVVITQARRGMP